MAKKVVNVQVRYSNSYGVTYVVKRFADGTGVINTFAKGRGNCYSQTGSKRIRCGKNNNNFVFL
jgi:hypothetical protein